MKTIDNYTMQVAPEVADHAPTNRESHALDLVNGYERQAIENLTAWVAEQQDLTPEDVRSITEASFGVRDVGAIPRKSYDEIIRFLVDLRIDDIRN